VCFWSTIASDPDLASTYRQYLAYVLPVSSVRDLGVYVDSDVSLRTQCQRHRQIVHRSTTSDSERPALSSTTRPADTNQCFGCQQGRLLLLRAGRCLRSSTGQAAVSPQRRRPTRVLSQALRTHHPASPRPSLVAGPETDSIPSLRSGIPMSRSMDQRRHISLRAFVGQPIATSALLPP